MSGYLYFIDHWWHFVNVVMLRKEIKHQCCFCAVVRQMNLAYRENQSSLASSQHDSNGSQHVSEADCLLLAQSQSFCHES